jgi:hypothetical protein
MESAATSIQSFACMARTKSTPDLFNDLLVGRNGNYIIDGGVGDARSATSNALSLV